MNDKKDTSLHTSPQLVESRDAVALSAKQTVSLYKKSKQSGIPFDILEEVYRRGFSEHFNDQKAFDRVNSFISEGFAVALDEDLMEKRGLWDNIHAKQERIKHGSGEHMRKPGSKGAPTAAALKASQTEAVSPAQQAAIAIAMKKAGKTPKNEDTDPCWTGYKQIGMKSKGGKQVPNCVPVEEEEVNELSIKTLKSFTQGVVKKDPGTVLNKHPTGDTLRRKKALSLALDKIRPSSAIRQPKIAANEEYTGAEKVSRNTDEPSSRFVGTDQLTKTYKDATPGYPSKLSTIKRVVREQYELVECNGNCTCGCGDPEVKEDAKGYKNPTGGLTQKGRDHYNRESGGHLKAPVTTPPSKLKKNSKAAGRRRSFCARMGGVKGPMRDKHGKPTRKALALRKWNC